MKILIADGIDPSCYGGSDGSASITVTGGTSPFTYAWDANTGNQTTQTATDLSEGTYFVKLASMSNELPVHSH